jgi:hypothetical protein
MRLPTSSDRAHQERLAELVSAASYGTVLIIAALVVVDAAEVASGWGWELLTGVGVATWLAHIYAEVLGNHIRDSDAHRAHEIGRAMFDGLPILLAAVAPAVALVLGRIEVLTPRGALWIAVLIAFLQLLGLGAFVGFVAPDDSSSSWKYAATTAALGLAVVLVLVALGH